jgi:F-type H+-transporting ATPase subunit gamma
MAKLKEIRKRIVSITNTRQVTSAMKMVSAAKLKKAQDRILQIAPYDKKLHEIVQNLSLEDSDSDIRFFAQPTIENVLVVVVGSNQGLCGGFNSNVVKSSIVHTLNNHDSLLKSGNICFLPVGRQVEKGLKSQGVAFESEENQLISDINYTEVSRFAQSLMQLFVEGKYQRIDIVYNKFKNAAVQELMADQFLPVPKPSKQPDDLAKSPSNYLFEPSQKEILDSLIPQWLVMHLFRILLDSNTAEQGARMTAMHQATDNATELIRDLKVKYNNARQSAITNEIVEITAGAEALKG